MLRVGIVGTGLIAAEHARAIAMLPELRLVAAADVDASRLQGFCDAFGVASRYQNAADLIDDSQIDLVAITTPPSSHEPVLIAALERDKLVFCEKPLAHSLASAQRIMDAEARHPGRVAVSYQMRYDPSFRRLIWLCRNGWIGAIESALIERHSYVPHSNVGKGWWGRWDTAGGGVLITQLVHELDVLLQAAGTPQSVRAHIDTRYTPIESEDCADATFRFANGATARCIASVNSGRLGGRIEICGTRGTIRLPWALSMKNPRENADAIAALDRAMPETKPASHSIVDRGIRFVTRRLGMNHKNQLTSHARLYREIARRAEAGEPLPVTPREAMDSLQLCMAAYESALVDAEIPVPLNAGSRVYGGVTKAAYDDRPATEKSTTSRGKAKLNSAPIRVGLIGLDTTHAPTMTSLLHDPYDPLHIPGGRVVAAYPGGSPDMAISISRVSGFTNELRNRYGITILDSPEAVADASDVVFILSSDGRVHPGLFRSVAGRGKPVFIDKPFALSTTDAAEIFAIAAQSDTKIFASSAFRYADGLVRALNAIRAADERVQSCAIRYWMQIQPTQGRYFWYGIHASEMLLAIMGKGIAAVETASNGDLDTITVLHRDGRQSSLIGSQSDGTFHVTITTDQRTHEIDLASSNASLSARLLASALDVLTDSQFPRLWRATSAGSVAAREGRGNDPDQEETMEVIRLLDAAERSYATKQRIRIQA